MFSIVYSAGRDQEEKAEEKEYGSEGARHELYE